MKAFNSTPVATLQLSEGSRINQHVIYKVDGVATDISGGAFKYNLRDKQDGTILDTITTTYTSDGTDGAYDYVYEIAELAALIAANTLPCWHEFYFSSDGTDAKYKIWYHGPVELDMAG